MESEFDTATLESEATKEYLAEEAENIKKAEMFSRPPNWRQLQLDDPKIGQQFILPEFNTEEGMKARGILDSNGEATPLGEDYLMLQDRGLLKDGSITKKGEAFITPTEDLLPTSEIANFSSTVDLHNPDNFKKFEMWKIREENGLNKKPKDEGNAIMNIIKGAGQMGESLAVITGPTSLLGTISTVLDRTPILSGNTMEQRGAAAVKFAEGASEMAVTSSGKLGSFLDEYVINPARRLAGLTQEQEKRINDVNSFNIATREALYQDTEMVGVVDAITNTETALSAKIDLLLLRVLVSGVAGGPAIHEMLELIGKDEIAKRINTAIDNLK